jgi:YesN/AraC family two-component response regulator
VDVLISDMVMPGTLSGLQLANRLQREKPGLKIIIVSGYSEEIARAEGGVLDGHMLLPKPFEIAALTSAIEKCMSSSKPASGRN